MQISFNGITIGYQEPYLIQGEVEGVGNAINSPVGFDIPFSNKSSFISNYARSRVITIDFKIVNDTKQQYIQSRQDLINALYVDENTVNTINIIDNAGNEYVAYGVLAGQPDLPIMYTQFSDASISFICYDVFIYNSLQISQSINIQEGTTGIMLPTMVPFTLPLSVNTVSINNEGIKAYPIYTITGEGTNFSIVNNSNNQSCKIGFTGNDFTKNSTQALIIDTFNNTVKQNGVSVYQYFQGDFITLQNGINNISFFADSGFNSGTTLTITYRTTYLGI